MLSNFQLLAITKSNGCFSLYQVRINREVQERLEGIWQRQYENFIDEIEEVNFDAGYKLEKDQKFQLTGFDMPAWLEDVSHESLRMLDSFTSDQLNQDATKGLMAVVDTRDGKKLLFQKFDRSHIIKPGFTLFLSGDTYSTIEQPSLSLGNRLDAVLLPKEGKLLFSSFRTVNSFLPLMGVWAEASDSQIREILNHSRLEIENIDTYATGASQWFRTRFAMLSDSKVLDDYTVREIFDRSDGYEINLRLNEAGDRIIFPSNKTKAKRLLQFLNEEIFRGVITETLYETNSKRASG